MMLIKSLKTFFNHFAKNKLYGAITILGFSFSLMFVILLGTYIHKEYSVDDFQVNKDRIFRLTNEERSFFAPPFGILLKDKYPQIESFTRIYKEEGIASARPEEKMKINYMFADSTFFKMFSFKLIKGTPLTASSTMMSIVLSKSYALKLYGKLPDIGQIIRINGMRDYTISGIMDDIPDNTHFAKVDAIVDFPSLISLWKWKNMDTNYGVNSFGLYIMEKPGTDITSRAPEILKLFKNVSSLYKRGYAKEVKFEPLTDIYFSNSFSPSIRQNSKKLLTVLSSIVAMILFLSMLNYINLTIAQSGQRSMEMAVKKVMGIKEGKLIGQYIIESTLVTFISFLLALILSFVFEPIFNSILNTHINLLHSINSGFILQSLLFVFLIGVVSGGIPAISIANFNLNAVLKGSFRMKNKGVYFKSLIAFQYIIIIALIISSVFIQKQTSYLQNYDLGFNKSNILSINNKDIHSNQNNAFKELLNSIPGVEHVCLVSGSPLDGGSNNSFMYKDKPLSFQTFKVDTSYFHMMGMEVIPTGVAYSDSIMWLNEQAVKELELTDLPISAKFYNKEFPVYGIVRNFNFQDLRHKIRAANFMLFGKHEYAESILIKISSKNTIQTVNRIKKAYSDFTNGTPIDISFMDEAINKWYEQEERIGKMLDYLTVLTIIISVMGLFAMSLFYVQQRTKEIGIRKVNGAKISEVMLMLNKTFVYWVAFSFIIATPIVWYAIHTWLENFAYKINMDWWVFAAGGAIALGIALLTVSWQSWKAATSNPVEALRNE